MARLGADTLDAIRRMEAESGDRLSAGTWDELQDTGRRRWEFWRKLSRQALVEVLELSARQRPDKRLSRHLRGLADAGRVGVIRVRSIHDRLISANVPAGAVLQSSRSIAGSMIRDHA